MRRASCAARGVDENGLAINGSELMAHKRAFTNKMPGCIEDSLNLVDRRIS